jgi:hypothetical protein
LQRQRKFLYIPIIKQTTERKKKMTNNVNVILTFDHKEQEIFDMPLNEKDIPKIVLRDEAFLVFYILLQSNEDLKDLVKVSLCFYVDDKLAKKKAISSSINRGAKYYFQPNQRDRIENSIIAFDKSIASETENFDVEQIKRFASIN